MEQTLTRSSSRSEQSQKISTLDEPSNAEARSQISPVDLVDANATLEEQAGSFARAFAQLIHNIDQLIKIGLLESTYLHEAAEDLDQLRFRYVAWLSDIDIDSLVTTLFGPELLKSLTNAFTTLRNCMRSVDNIVLKLDSSVKSSATLASAKRDIEAVIERLNTTVSILTGLTNVIHEAGQIQKGEGPYVDLVTNVSKLHQELSQRPDINDESSSESDLSAVRTAGLGMFVKDRSGVGDESSESHHSAEISKQSRKIGLSRSKVLHRCKYCSDEFITQEDLDRHIGNCPDRVGNIPHQTSQLFENPTTKIEGLSSRIRYPGGLIPVEFTSDSDTFFGRRRQSGIWLVYLQNLVWQRRLLKSDPTSRYGLSDEISVRNTSLDGIFWIHIDVLAGDLRDQLIRQYSVPDELIMQIDQMSRSSVHDSFACWVQGHLHDSQYQAWKMLHGSDQGIAMGDLLVQYSRSIVWNDDYLAVQLRSYWPISIVGELIEKPYKDSLWLILSGHDERVVSLADVPESFEMPSLSKPPFGRLSQIPRFVLSALSDGDDTFMPRFSLDPCDFSVHFCNFFVATLTIFERRTRETTAFDNSRLKILLYDVSSLGNTIYRVLDIDSNPSPARSWKLSPTARSTLRDLAEHIKYDMVPQLTAAYRRNLDGVSIDYARRTFELMSKLQHIPTLILVLLTSILVSTFFSTSFFNFSPSTGTQASRSLWIYFVTWWIVFTTSGLFLLATNGYLRNKHGRSIFHSLKILIGISDTVRPKSKTFSNHEKTSLV